MKETALFLIVAVGSVSILVSVLWMMLARHLKPSTFQERKDFIQLLAQILGGATIIITLFSTWYSVRDGQRKAEEGRVIAENNLKISTDTLKENRYRQITDRYARAVEQLGNKDLRSRIGSLYALGQVGNDSDELYPSVVEVLALYVVENASLKKAIRSTDEIPTDIQAVFNILGWRKRAWEKGEDRRLELHGVDLRGLILKDKEGVNDSGAHLEGAQLWNSRLDGDTTNLRGIQLQNAILHGANLENAKLVGANLLGADLNGANLEGADLSFAKVTLDRLTGASNFECAIYDPQFEKSLEEYMKKRPPEEFDEFEKNKGACRRNQKPQSKH